MKMKMKSGKYFTSAWSFLVVALAVPALTSCTAEEVAQGVGAGAIIAGAVAIGATTHCEAGYENVCHSYFDFLGRAHTECSEEYNSCAILVPNSETLAVSADRNVSPAPAQKAQALPQVTQVDWGNTFGISFQASAQIISACELARDKKDASGLYALGLTDADLANIAEHKLPSDSAIEAMSKTLNQKPAAIQEMLQRLIANSPAPTLN